jgi:GDP-L-fucose synthase
VNLEISKKPKMKKILLTGGSGLVGRNIQEHSSADKWEILTPSRKELDLTDLSSVSQWVKNHQPDIIIHAAGLVGGIKANIQDPVKFLDVNVSMGRNIIMVARDCNVTKLINLGSSCMYPKSIHSPLTEEKLMAGKLEPTNEGYALAKLFTTKLCQYISTENSNMQFKTMIPCNIYGKHDNFNLETAHLLPAIIQKIHTAKVDNLNTVSVWGDGTVRREFLYAEDLADAILLAVEDLHKIPNIMNIGFGLDYSVNEYYKTVAEVMNWKGTLVHDLSMPIGMMQKLNGIDRQKKWGWTAQTSLKVGIKKTYQYFLESLR